MRQVSISEIESKARDFSKTGKSWHFHILTQECQLNKQNGYALVLENTTDEEVFVCYSDEPYIDMGKKLVKLLHGEDVVKDKNTESKETKPSEQVVKILERARELNEVGKTWHHHMLFPGCIFNKHAGKYAIIFEDKQAGEVIESVSDDEPKSDLQHIETLFYQQKKAG